MNISKKAARINKKGYGIKIRPDCNIIYLLYALMAVCFDGCMLVWHLKLQNIYQAVAVIKQYPGCTTVGWWSAVAVM
jgi:hypothetical protein